MIVFSLSKGISMRALALLTTVMVTAVTLAGCSTTPSNSPTGSSQPCTPAGSLSQSVKVEGSFGSDPTVTFPTPLVATTTERTVVIPGDGPQLQSGQVVNLKYAIYNATTGEKTEDSFSTNTSETVTFNETQLLPGIAKALNCSTVGSRIVAVIAPSDGYGGTGKSAPGEEANESLIFIFDIDSVVPNRADGVDQPPEPGFPTVTLAENGQPTVTIPDTAAPTEFKEAVLKKGTGPAVQAGNDVTVQYQGIVWNTKKIFDQSWGKSPTTFSTNSVVKGFSQGLVGQTVGSQVIIIIPPDLGYGANGNQQAGISGTDTLVFVVDILSTAPGKAAPSGGSPSGG